MSAAAGATPPDPPGAGSSKKMPAGEGDDGSPWPENDWNVWNKNVIKTAKCKICGDRVTKYSWMCPKCNLRICSECAEGKRDPFKNHIAADQLMKGCHCKWMRHNGSVRPGLIPELMKKGIFQPPPPKRFEEDARNRQIKADIKKRKEEAEKKRLTDAANAESVSADGNGQDADDVFTTAATTRPTLTSVKTPRIGVSQKRYKESSPEDEDAPHSKKQSLTKKRSRKPIMNVMRACAHLDNGHTVIVGAGVIGLCVAFELANKARKSNTNHTISVVEIRASYAQMASANCAGIISAHGVPDHLLHLQSLTVEGWQDLTSSRTFRAATGFKSDVVFHVARLGNCGNYKPSWYIGHQKDSLHLDDNETIGKLNSLSLVKWLYDACRALGVIFYFNHEVTDVQSTPEDDINSVNIRDISSKLSTLSKIKCQNLVLAAGPWTTEIFKNLFPHSGLVMENQIRLVPWFRVPMSLSQACDDVGLVFPDLATLNDVLEDEIMMVAQAQTQHLIITGASAATRDQFLHPKDALDPSNDDLRPARCLKKIANKKLGHPGPDTLTDAHMGFSLVSTSDEDLPVLDKVPASSLGAVCSGDKDCRPCGVWLCFGFGLYGTSLAPGIARALCRRMFGEKSGIDDSTLAIPQSSAVTDEDD